MFDLGTQRNKFYEKDEHKVRIVWELTDIRMTWDDKDMPRAYTQTFTLSLHKKAKMRGVLESWRGKSFTDKELENGFDLSKLLGVPCQIQIIHRPRKDGDGIYADMSAILPKPAGWTPKPENPLKFFSFEEYAVDGVVPDGIPEKTLEAIKNAPEFDGLPPEKEHPKQQEPSGLIQVPTNCKHGEPGSYIDPGFCEGNICNKTCAVYKDWMKGQIPF